MEKAEFLEAKIFITSKRKALYGTILQKKALDHLDGVLFVSMLQVFYLLPLIKLI